MRQRKTNLRFSRTRNEHVLLHELDARALAALERLINTETVDKLVELLADQKERPLLLSEFSRLATDVRWPQGEILLESTAVQALWKHAIQEYRQAVSTNCQDDYGKAEMLLRVAQSVFLVTGDRRTEEQARYRRGHLLALSAETCAARGAQAIGKMKATKSPVKITMLVETAGNAYIFAAREFRAIGKHTEAASCFEHSGNVFFEAATAGGDPSQWNDGKDSFRDMYGLHKKHGNSIRWTGLAGDAFRDAGRQLSVLGRSGGAAAHYEQAAKIFGILARDAGQTEQWKQALSLCLDATREIIEAEGNEETEAASRIQQLEHAIREGCRSAGFPDKFDKLSKNVVDNRDSSKSEEEQIGQGIAPQQERPPLDEDFVEAALAIQTKLLPAVTAADIAQLEATIAGAQINPPANKQAFVDAINQVLDGRNLRLRVEGQTDLARLCVNNGSIGLSLARGGKRGFRRVKINVERVAEEYGKLGRSGRPSPREP